MRKFSLLSEQIAMSATAYVDQASSLAKRLVSREATGPGDTENAMRRCEAKYGLPYGFLWSLRYRRPKRVFVDLYVRLEAAVEDQRRQQERLFEHERCVTEAKTWVGKALVRAASAVAGEKGGMSE